jgi:uncharacterized membrane protein YgcG
MCIVRFAATVTMYVFTARNVTHIIKQVALRARVKKLEFKWGKRTGGRGGYGGGGGGGGSGDGGSGGRGD